MKGDVLIEIGQFNGKLCLAAIVTGLESTDIARARPALREAVEKMVKAELWHGIHLVAADQDTSRQQRD